MQCVNARYFEEEIGGIFVVPGAKGVFGRCGTLAGLLCCRALIKKDPLLSPSSRQIAPLARLTSCCVSVQECAPNSWFPLIDYVCER